MHERSADLLYRIGQGLAALVELDELLPYVITRVKEVFEVESAAVLLLDAEGKELYFPYVDDRDPVAAERLRSVRIARDQGIAGWVLSHGEPALVSDAGSDPRFYAGVDRELGRTTKSLLCAPLRTRAGVIGVLEVINRGDRPFAAADLELLDALSGSVAIAIENARLFAELRQREAALRREVTSLRSAAADHHHFGSIIAGSPAMQEMLRLLESAIDTPINVLIEGETGTGKELVARAIHYNGPRGAHAFVAINCAALNENLLESELFGHRRGAFTGAISDKKGLFEVAHEGTVLLDEIGETSAAFQAKLLRVLQEGEVLPVGDTRPRRVNVRLVSATNRDLLEEVRGGRFREDLYYRIATFPIHLPPLRERREDIPALADHLLRRVADRFQRDVRGLDPAALALLEGYAWPGNVRELENELERAVSLTPKGGTIGVAQISERIRAAPAERFDEESDPTAPLSLRPAVDRFVREHLERALAANRGNVSHAARALGISRVVLQRKMKVLGLREKASGR